MATKPRFFGQSEAQIDKAFCAEQSISNQAVEGFLPDAKFVQSIQQMIDGTVRIEDMIEAKKQQYGSK